MQNSKKFYIKTTLPYVNTQPYSDGLCNKMNFLLSKEQLEKWYLKDRLSTWAIEKKYGFSRGLVYKKLLEFGIPTRTLASSHFKTPRRSFNGTENDKAYIVGFSTGDLRVRLHNKKGLSETISIACSSSKIAQVKLIKDFFAPYGHIWTGKPNYRNIVSIEAYVDLSFNFLFKDKLEEHLKSFITKNQFLSFLAGFSDAEGSIFLSRGMARMAWGNYNLVILEYIKMRLTDIGISTSSVYCDNLKGYVGKDGYKRKSNYYHLVCSTKKDLYKLLKILKPFIRHEEKLKRLDIAIYNIEERNKKFPWTTKRKTLSI